MRLRKFFPSVVATCLVLGACGPDTPKHNGVSAPIGGTNPPSPPPGDSTPPNVVAATAVGATDGEFNVGQGGDASYSIPLNLLKGTAGIQPSLSLVYNSSGGDSPLGVGWSLGGQSVITRCGTTIVQDRFVDGRDFDSNDKYCLDGQRLVAISGNYGADGTEYRTEVDNFARIYSQGQGSTGDPERFVVYSNTGQILQYGHTDDSLVEGVMVPSGGLAPIASWALNRVEDRLGNYMTYSYVELATDDGYGQKGSEHYLARIDYTGNAAAKASPYASVTFEYEPRPDPLISYEAGAHSLWKVRLKRVVNTSGDVTVRSYQLSYGRSAAAGRSVLSAVQECGSDGTCLSPTTFAGSAVTPGFAPTARLVIAASAAGTGLSNHSTENYHETFADMDGDGDMDRAWIPVGQSSIYVALWRGTDFGPPTVWLAGPATPGNGQVPAFSDLGKHEAWVDMNGDGKTDRVWVPSGTRDIYVALSTGTAFGPPQIWLRDQAFPGLASFSQDGLHETFGDIDGDGRTDYIWVPEGPEGTVPTYAALNTGTAFAAPTAVFPLHAQLVNTSDAGYEDYLDLNNDGLVDYTWIPKGSAFTNVALANDDPRLTEGVRFDPPAVWLGEDTRPPSDAQGRANFRIFEDMTGDGVGDLVFYKVNGACAEIRVAVNSGRSFLPSRVLATSCPGDVPLGSTDVRYQQFIDLNDDGRADHVWVPSDRNTIWVAYNQGSSFAAPQELINASVGVTPRSLSDSFLDVDGDGAIDRIWIPEDAPNGRVYMLPGNRVSHRLETITNGFGRQIRITYDTLINPSVYTQDHDASFPLLDVSGPMVVVSRTSISDGIGGFRERGYGYQGMKMHLQGFGNLGMRQTSEVEGAKPVATVRYFSQDYANRMQGTLIGGLTFHRKADAKPSDPLGDQLVGVTSFANQYQVTLGAGLYRVRLLKTDTEERDLFNTLVSRRSTENLEEDAYGNTTSLRLSTYDGEGTLVGQSVTTNTYTNDAAIWSLGLLTRVEVTRSRPNADPAVPSITRTTSQTWDVAKRLLTQEVVEPDASEFKVTTAYQYDSFGNTLETTLTPNGMPARVSTATYDATGRFPITSTNALGQTTTADYDFARGLLSSVTDANELVTSFQYDGYGRRTLETRPDATHTTTTFFACNATCPQFATYGVSRATPGQPDSSTYFDVLGREIRLQGRGRDGRAIFQDITYDTFGRRVAVSEPYFGSSGETVFWTRAEYDTLDRAFRITNPDGSVSSTSYQANRVVETNELMQTRTEIRDALGNLIEVLDAQSNRLRYRHDALGNLIEVLDPMNNATRVTYDRLGRKTVTEDPDKGRLTYAYDPLGQLIRQTDAKDQATSFEYDAIGRATYRVDHDGGATLFTYDGAPKGIGAMSRVAQTSCSGKNRMQCMTALGTTTDYNEVMAYDDFGRPAGVTTTIKGEAFTVSNTYDAVGRVDVTTYPAGAGAALQVRSSYSPLGYLSEITDVTRGTRFWKAERSDARGNLTLATLGNGLSAERRYDPASGRLTLIQTDVRGQVAVQQLVYDFDALGNMRSRRDALQNQIEIATYDPLNRLAGVETRRVMETLTDTVTYDALGNIVTRSGMGTYSYGGTCSGVKAGPHAVVSVGGEGAPSTKTYCYDANGDMIRADDREVAYSSFGKPIRFVQGNTETLFTYGPNRQRYQRVDAAPSGNSTTTYVRGYFERTVDSAGTTYRNFIGDFAIYTETVPMSGEAVTSVHYVHRDHLDSVDAITDAQGRIVERFSYDAWGKRRNPDWSPADDATALASDVTPRGFTNQEHIDNFDLVHMNGRVYDPVIGRFLSADPFVQSAGNLQSFNRYSYVLDNPLSFTDPSGFFSLKKFLKKAFDVTFGKKSFLGAIVRGVRSVLRGVAKVWAKVPGLQVLAGAIICAGTFGTGCAVFSAFSAAVQLSAGASLGDVVLGAAIGFGAGLAADFLVNIQGATKALSGLGITGKLAKAAAEAANSGLAGGIAAEAQGKKFSDGFIAGARSAGIRATVAAARTGALADIPALNADNPAPPQAPETVETPNDTLYRYVNVTTSIVELEDDEKRIRKVKEQFEIASDYVSGVRDSMGFLTGALVLAKQPAPAFASGLATTALSGVSGILKFSIARQKSILGELKFGLEDTQAQLDALATDESFGAFRASDEIPCYAFSKPNGYFLNLNRQVPPLWPVTPGEGGAGRRF